jgi:ABC-type phosphate/phosphonate transport system substrate-binding protein
MNRPNVMNAVAGLPMYDFPEIRPATDAFWTALAARLRAAGLAAVPDDLTRPKDLLAFWRDPGLLLGQTCGYPLTALLKGSVRVVATPVYRAPGCRGAEHCSVIVAGAGRNQRTLGEFRGGVCAVNGFDSNTGMNLLRATIAPLAEGKPFFREVTVTGSHAASLEAVAAGRADVAAIDCVTFAHLRRLRPDIAAGVQPIAETPQSPALPLVTAASTDDATIAVLRAGLADVAQDPALDAVRDTLLIVGYEVLPEAAYDRVLTLEAEAVGAGYPVLA